MNLLAGSTYRFSRSSERVMRLACEDLARRADIISSPIAIRVNAPEKIAIFRELNRFTCGEDVTASTVGGAADVLAAVPG